MTKLSFNRRSRNLFFILLIFIFAGISSSCVFILNSIFDSIDIHGTVNGDNGTSVKPLEGISVTLYSSEKDEIIASAVTDPKGYYKITISSPAGDYGRGHLSFDDEQGIWESENYSLDDINKCTYKTADITLEPRSRP